jgi:hypothetical protein
VLLLTAQAQRSDTAEGSPKRSEFVGSLKTKPGLRRYTPHLDGKWLLRTSDATLTPEDLAAAYKQLLAGHKRILAALEVPEPPRFYDITTD